MNETEAIAAVNGRVRVANTLIRQALRLIQQNGLSGAAHGRAETVVDAQLIADLQLSMTALRRAWNGAE